MQLDLNRKTHLTVNVETSMWSQASEPHLLLHPAPFGAPPVDSLLHSPYETTAEEEEEEESGREVSGLRRSSDVGAQLEEKEAFLQTAGKTGDKRHNQVNLHPIRREQL